jgi:predicted Fe-Mo cluster-binding NifX family protein
MRVAVASADGTSISQHFGRCACFIIFEIENGKVLRKEVRSNTYTAHGRGDCHGGGHGDRPHSHAAVVEALRDCQAVLCYGMGWRAAEELSQNGIQPLIIDGRRSPEEAVGLYLQGQLTPLGQEFCAGHLPEHG